MSNENAVATFDPAKIQDGIRARIRGMFVDAIPDDAWKAMIEKEIKDFMEVRVVQSGYYDHRAAPSHFTEVVREELTKELRGRCAAYFTSQEWITAWEGNKAVACDQVKALLVKAAPEILASMFQSAFQQHFDSIRQRM